MFNVIDNRTGKPVTWRVTQNMARKSNLIICDIEGFFLSEDGQTLILADECGNYMFVDPKRFSVKEN